jgi:tetratricopeptide (TPR) repeat protein
VRVLLSIGLAVCLPALSQTDSTAKFESLLAEAQQAQARGDYRTAADAYSQAVAIRADLPQLWSNLGLMEYESRQYPEAEKALRRALTLDKSLFVPNLFLGLDLLELKRPGDAVGYLIAAEKLKPQDPQVLLALGRAYHALLDVARSRQWYQRAVDVVPRNGDAWFGLGVAYFELAASASAKLTAAFTNSPYVTELTADSLAEQGRLTQAIERYRVMLASHEQPPRCARTSYGLALLRHGDRGQAEEQFERDLNSCPAAKLGKDRLLPAGNNRDEALTPRPAPQPERPLPALGKLTESDLQQVASDAFFAGDFRAAAQAADQLRQRYPNHPAGWYWAVRAYQKLGVAALTRAGEVEPESPRIHALLGDVYQRRGMFREAEQEYSKILALQPDNIAGLAGLAAAYLHDARLDEAQAAARKALDRDPNDSEINILMGEILVAQRQYETAEPYLRHGLTARPDLLPRVHALLGRVYARAGRSKEAINELNQGLASDEDGSVYYQLARLYQNLGETKNAAAAFEKSRQIRAKRDVIDQQSLEGGSVNQ